MPNDLLPEQSGGLPPQEGVDQYQQQVPSRREAIESAIDGGRQFNRDQGGRFAPNNLEQTPGIPTRRDMPKSWKQDYAPHWGSIPDPVANLIAEQEELRERQVMEGVNKYKGLAQNYEGLRQVITPHEQSLTQNYGSVQAGLQYLFQLSDAAASDPMGFISWFAQQRGLDLRQLAANQGQQVPTDQYQQALQAAIQPYAQQVTGVTQYLRQQAVNQQQANQTASLKSVESFFGEKDQQGTQNFPLDEGSYEEFAKRVRFVRSHHADWDDRRVLEAAYNDFAWTTDSMRVKLLEKESQSMKAKQQQQLAAKKSAAVLVKGAPSSSPGVGIDPKDRRAIIEKAMANLNR